MRSGNFLFGNEAVESFENALGKYLDIKYVIGVASGTDALMIALKACGVEAEDEVIVPAVSAFSSAGAVRWIGAVPVFVDVREDGNINPDLIERAN